VVADHAELVSRCPDRRKCHRPAKPGVSIAQARLRLRDFTGTGARTSGANAGANQVNLLVTRKHHRQCRPGAVDSFRRSRPGFLIACANVANLRWHARLVDGKSCRAGGAGATRANCQTTVGREFDPVLGACLVCCSHLGTSLREVARDGASSRGLQRATAHWDSIFGVD
jgi:hypothetical protein